MTNAYESLVPCPHCGKRNIQTVVSYNVARGRIISAKVGKRRFVGCAPCAAAELRKESGRALLYGWLSPTALVLTLVNAPWNFGRSFFVRPNKTRVMELFEEIGVPTSAAETDPALSLHAAIAAMIHADRKIQERELEAAHEAAPRYFEKFNPELLTAMLARPALSVRQIGALLKNRLSDEDKARLIRLLHEIAHSDGDYDRREAALLRRIGDALGAPHTLYDELRDRARKAGA